MKTCTVCLKYLPLDQFYFNHTCKDNRFSWCVKCCREYRNFRREKRQEEKKANNIPRKPWQRFFYGRRIPLPPDPDHAIHIVQQPITLTFD